MTAKAQKKADNWTAINPPIPITIEHVRSHDQRTLMGDARYRGRVEARWPGAGVVVFDLATGYGASEARDWMLTLESARAVLGNPEHEFKRPNFTDAGKPKVYGKPKQPSGQLSLLDYIDAYSSGKVVPSVPPAPHPAGPAAPPSSEVKDRHALPGHTRATDPMRPAFGPHDYEGQGRERYHDTPEGERAGLVGAMTAQLTHGTPEPDRAFARGWLDEHWRATRAPTEASPEPGKELQRKAHAYLMREGACCEVRHG